MLLTVCECTKDDCANKIHVAENKCSPVARDSSGLQLQFLLCQISLWSEKNSQYQYGESNNSNNNIINKHNIHIYLDYIRNQNIFRSISEGID